MIPELSAALLSTSSRTEAEFKPLCQRFQEEPASWTRFALLNFCGRHQKDPEFQLGYFLIALRDFQQAQYETAARQFEKIDIDRSPLADYILYYYSSTLSHLGRNGEALEKAQIVLDKFPNSPMWENARNIYWENCLLADRPAKILETIQKYKKGGESSSLLYFQARGLEQSGQPDQAMPLFQKVFYLFPLTDEAPKAAERLKILIPALSIPPPPPLSLFLARAEQLLSANRYTEALAYLQNLQKQESVWGGSNQFQAWLGLAYLKKGNTLEATKILTNLTRQPGELAAEAICYLSETCQKMENPAGSEQWLQTLEQRSPQSPWFEKALFSLGNYYLVHRQLPEAASTYQKVFYFFPKGKHARDAYWRVIWHQYRQHNYSLAADLFLDHLSRFPESEYAPAALYWLARSWQNLNRADWAQRVFLVMARRYSHSYYGQLALRQLPPSWKELKIFPLPTTQAEQLIKRFEQIIPPPPPGKLCEPNPSVLARWPRVAALHLLSLDDWAGRELLRNREYGNSPEILPQAASLFQQAGLFRTGIQLMRQLVPTYLECGWELLPAWFWTMVFPAQYFETIGRECRKRGLDPYLVLALILQESSFDPRAVSPANAYGLMQLLPPTARLLAKRVGMKRPRTEQLFDPSINIPLGVYHFSDLMKDFDGQEEKALASYNAGSSRVRAWSEEGGYADASEFIESIPFSETRSYVKIILRDRWFYRQRFPQRSITP